MRLLLLIAALVSVASASVTIPYVFSPSTQIKSAEVNADFSAVANEINSHEAAVNPHQTTLASILALNNSCGAYAINFNGKQAINMEVENRSSDPSAGSPGRLFFNTVDGLLKFDDGSSIISIAGTGVNTLSSVLNAGNSAGAFNINLNENQLLNARVENRSSDPSTGNAGRIWWNTTGSALKLDTGSAVVTVGGSQGLSSVLGVSNSAGSTNINFNSNQAQNMVLHKLSSDPGSPATGQIWYNTTSNIPKFYDGSSILAVGNTNTLAQTLSLGNTVGSSDVNFNGHQAQSMVLYNNSGSPGTGTGGFVWYDTGNSQIGYETSGANHYLANLDSSQTLTNKTISGSSNTVTNIQDSSLSSNVDLLASSQSFTGVKTFSTAPVMGSIKSTSAATLTVPTGTSNDTFALLNTTQTLLAKTLTTPTLTGNADYSEGQALHFRVENLSSDPTAGNSGRLYYKTTTGELKYDDGSNTRVLSTSNPNLSQVLSSGSSAGGSNIDLNFNQLLNARVQNVAGLPAAGYVGRIVYDTVTSAFYVDNGSAWTSAGSGISYGADTGAANAYVVSPSPSLSAYATGSSVSFTAANANTGASTINVSGLGVKSIKIPGGAALTQGDILSGQVVALLYDGTNFQMISPQGQTTSASTAYAAVKRDGSGNFSAGTVTASLTGNVTGNLSGNQSGGTVSATTVTANSATVTGAIQEKQTADALDGGLVLYSTDGSKKYGIFVLNAGNFGIRDVTGGESIFNAVNIYRGTGPVSPIWGWDVTGADTNTTQASPAAPAAISARNTSATANNFSSFIFTNSNQQVSAALEGVHESHTTGKGHISFMTNDGSSLAERAYMNANGIDVKTNNLSSQLTNSGTTGTTTNKLVKINSSGQAVVTAISDTSGAVGIAVNGAGTSGSVDVAQVGRASCVFDNATTAGDYVQISSSVAGDCTDAGASVPSTGQTVGRVLSTNGSAGTYAIAISVGGGGTGTVSSVALSDASTTPIYTISGSPVTSTGTLTFTLSTQTTNKVFAAPNGSTGQPGFRLLVGADLPNPSSSTLGGVQSYAAVSNQWINAISTSGVPSSAQPAFTNISGTALETQGGTNQTTYALGDTLYSSAANTLSKLSGNTTATRKFLSQTGNGSVSAAPSWVQPAFTDITSTVSVAQVHTVTATRASPTSITAGGGITATASVPIQSQFVQGSGGAVTVTANPQISAGNTVGQLFYLIGRSDSSTLTLADGTGLSLKGGITLYADCVLTLYWDGTNWLETARSCP